MTQHPLAGVYAAAVTPLKSDSSLDLDSVPAFLTFLASRGCHGALLFGTTGEGPSFSLKEREVLMRSVKDARDQMPDFRLLAGTGTPSLDETIRLTKLSFDLGFEGVIVLPPYYYRKASDDGLFHWFSDLINKAVPKDKFLLGYHIPGAAGVGFSIDLLKRLRSSFPVQFAGIKDSSHDSGFAQSLGDVFGDEMLVLTGTDTYLQLAMQNKASGCITAPANIISQELREVWNLMGENKDALETQERVSQLRHILDQYQPFPPTLKALLHKLYGLPRWTVKPPLEDLAEGLTEKITSELGTLVS